MAWEEFHAAEQRIKKRARNKLAKVLKREPENDPGGSPEEDERTFWRWVHEQGISMLTEGQARDKLDRKLDKISRRQKNGY